jgi:hypothetical protein
MTISEMAAFLLQGGCNAESINLPDLLEKAFNQQLSDEDRRAIDVLREMKPSTQAMFSLKAPQQVKEAT